MKKDQFKSKNSKIPQSVKTVEEAIQILKDSVKGNFDHTFEMQVGFKVSEKNKQDVIRISWTPAHSFGKEVKVAVLADPQNTTAAKESGADYVGLDDLIEKMEGGWFDFDVLIATPAVMPKLAKLGKILGPKGLMPNPKTETVTADLDRVVKGYKKGKLDFKLTESKQMAFKFGKVSMTQEQLIENLSALVTMVKSESKKFGENGIKVAYIKTTMSPSIQVKL